MKAGKNILSVIAALAVFAMSHIQVAYAQEPEPESTLEKSSPSAEQKTGDTAEQGAAEKKDTSEALVEKQSGCKITIQGLQETTKKSALVLTRQDGSKAKATVISFSNGKTLAALSGASCKQNAKGWKVSIGADPEMQAIQVGRPLVFEPKTSGWYRAKRDGSYFLGLGAGMSWLGRATPTYRLELGRTHTSLDFLIGTEFGAANKEELAIKGSSYIEFRSYIDNSEYLSFGWGREVRTSIFTGKKIVAGEIKDAFLSSGSSDLTFLHIGFGNKWQWGGFAVAVEWLGCNAITSREDSVEVVDLVTTSSAEGTIEIQTKKLTDEANVALNKQILRKNVGEGAALRLLFTSISYAF